MSRVARAVIDHAALRHNLAVAREAVAPARVIAVLKANGYGHGLLGVADALREAEAFAVSCLEEALPLREAGFQQRLVLLEGPFTAAELPVFARRQLDAVVHTDWQVAAFEGARLPAPVDVWLKVDTGMGRLGFPPERAAGMAARLAAAPAVGTLRFMTHLACADDREDDTTHRQLELFDEALRGLEGERSIANSAGTLGWHGSHAQWVRPGIMLYGCQPFVDGLPAPALRPTMRLEARLIAVNHHRRGDRIGYGGTFVCPEDMPVGVASIGYGDGYPRHAPNGTPVQIRGRRAGVAGRVSMDMTCIDLRAVPEAEVGDTVVLWGEDPGVEEVAELCGTIGYELYCQVTPRVQRWHQRGG
ncbi:alanine racemase [Sediminicurvatus halobius]|uniref:Alanine racemase n=1 Tax=Sediminicurvatus halobius TaxID=2182432 RepID=A0A2U2MX68_9GAMM|nr:alanine racemase [Spiribacter halobius]PWG61422.1 alanine racemase [Spiribacter halobius]UEX76954.1 alanine racemase [Spiribacter halobius]